ncbi:ABC transporter permease [uncultured Slackia sp.]|uniref:ABC transporter permease n=1 Tax=uncultured Slackia sp. TaxID=665903 RepID=UPI00260E5F1F|nr:ABC transporter permease [uncultured Slackia sp.]
MAQLRKNLTEKMESNPGKVRFRRWKAMSIGARISLIVLTLIVLIAALANFIAPHDPLEIFTARQAPDAEFIFGTDDKGRDVLSRMMYGARYSLVIGLGATAFALVCGSIIGALAAVSRKWVSEVIMRVLDVVMSFPGIALAATFVVVFGTNIPSLIFAIGFLYIPQIARIVRANIVSEYNQDYVRAVVVSGARAPWILMKHVVTASRLSWSLPSSLSPTLLSSRHRSPSLARAFPSPRLRGAIFSPTHAAAFCPAVGGRLCSRALLS